MANANDLENLSERPRPHRRDSVDKPGPRRAWKSASVREKLKRNFKIVLGVIPLTLIIWIYAEREQIVIPPTYNCTSVPVTIRSSVDNRVAEPAGNASPTVDLKLSGPLEAIDRVKSTLAQQRPRGLLIDIGKSFVVARDQPVYIVEQIQNNTLFKENGVTVLESQPPAIVVNVDQKDSILLPVEIPAEITNLDPQSHFDPPRVTVTGPRALLQRLQARGELHAYAQLSNLTGTGELPPRPVTVTLSSEDTRLSLAPTQVTGSLLLRTSEESFTIDLMPINVTAPVDTFNGFTITVNGGNPFIQHTDVTGPPEQIESLKQGKTADAPYAELVLVAGDDVKHQPKKLRYILPEGVHVKPDDANRLIDFTLTGK